VTDLAQLQGAFQRASMSNENDRGPLGEHPEWLVLSDRAVTEGRMRVALEAHGAAIGFATYLVAHGAVELEDLFVDPVWMRRGVAKALVLDLSARLQAMGFDTLEVTANPHAMAFYEHMGFVQSGIVDTDLYAAPRMWWALR
jgi:GNAT superfamily N-acetyltransferase